MTEEYTKLQKKTKYDYVKTAKKENFLFLNENFCKNGQTVLLGDSITELFNSYELFFAFSQKYGQAVYNRGISGDTSDRLSERLKCNALNLEPRNLVLLIGTNDLGVGLPQEFIVENIRETLKMTRALCPNTNIVLQAVYPVNRHLEPCRTANGRQTPQQRHCRPQRRIAGGRRAVRRNLVGFDRGTRR